MARSAEDRAPNHRGLSTDMCGIAGLYNTSGRPVDLHVLEAMTQVQAHRGPDGEGYALMSIGGQEKPFSVRGQLQDSLASGAHPYAVGFGHRRLAIVDLTLGGPQPMATPDERCWVTYNGEIYNYLELRDELRAHGHRFRSGSDTEVLLAAYRQWGEDCVRRFNGMFAFALWDGDRRRLFCARDRLGEKPFYYHWNGEQFAFASEVKGLLAAGVRPSPNHRTMYDYLEGGALDYGDATFFENVRQLPPAHCLILDGQRLALARYWDVPPAGERPFIRPVLDRTGAESHYAFPDPKEFAATLLQLIWQQDEPFGSTSVFAQWNVMRLASRTGVKVVLDGQGADELLAGYHGFFGAFFADLIMRRQWMSFTRELFSYWRLHGLLTRHAVANLARALLPGSLVGHARDRLTGSVEWLEADFRRQWGAVPSEPAVAGSPFQRLQDKLLTGNGLRALLHYEDRNSMAFGIEARLPFLDYRVVEFLSGVDPAYKIRLGWTKAVLTDAMEGILPDEVRWRVDKMGFVTPEHRWFRTSLREMAREILTDARTRARGYLNVDAALRAFDAQVAGGQNIRPTILRGGEPARWGRRL